MRISEQARRAAAACDESAFVSDDAEIIQCAINEHEADMIDAAQELLRATGAFRTAAALKALEAALEKRKASLGPKHTKPKTKNK